MKKNLMIIFLMFMMTSGLLIKEHNVYAEPSSKETVQNVKGILVAEEGLQLVYGNPDLQDNKACVLFIVGDGFTENEQDKFYESAKELSEYIMKVSPWDEYSDTIKIYGLGVISNESGAKGESSSTQEEADEDQCDNAFGSSFWSDNTQRLLTVSVKGEQQIEQLKKTYVPFADCKVVITNSSTYGGSGGDICVTSLERTAREIILHELGHTIANLADEYYAGAQFEMELANMTKESDANKVRWARFVGKNGVGVYEYEGGGEGWYRPHNSCKMRYLGSQHEFCEVCKEQLRTVLSQKSNITKLFFQTYAEEFYASETGTDMRNYFIIRRSFLKKTGKDLGDALTLTYKDSEGNIVDGIPNEAGTYTVEAVFTGNSLYEPCTQTGTYVIQEANTESDTGEADSTEKISDVSEEKNDDSTNNNENGHSWNWQAYMIVMGCVILGGAFGIITKRKSKKD